jgi:hypothetical protein
MGSTAPDTFAIVSKKACASGCTSANAVSALNGRRQKTTKRRGRPFFHYPRERH